MLTIILNVEETGEVVWFAKRVFRRVNHPDRDDHGDKPAPVRSGVVGSLSSDQAPVSSRTIKGRVEHNGSSSTGREESPNKHQPKGKAKIPTVRMTRVVEWVHDKERLLCCLCDRKFGMIVRRHHCRLCGEVVCNRCSLSKVQISGVKKQARYSTSLSVSCVGVFT